MAPTRTRPADNDYRFDVLRTRHVLDDLRYRPTDPGPGDLVPPFDLPTLDGGRFRHDDLGPRPVLLVVGSQTCPVTRSAAPRLDALHATYGDRVRFVLVQTREAHPGEHLPQPRTDEEKTAHAVAMRDDLRVTYEVAVDDVDGTLHRALGPKPNSAYVLRPDGTIVARVHWANDTAGVRAALDDALDGRPPRHRRGRMLLPLMTAVGHLPDVVHRAGPRAERDVWRAAAPLALLARATRLLGALATDRRGPVVAAGLAVVVAATVVAVVIGAAG
ncbi:alkyl hydroperoxide reductase/ Thiol specific antioxidant/ Mal allergen [Cellulomonas flavigena DSM 20109]|uniref:Alkyl hydroperoxide reductase/ Thiol specific antioxidant/ Mal allergen n=1 Tax=Cellulomonas flavigena (strain ATCC 482 / DSM 20109 / BCRC 11376 / JCM 18109 / NBRC 3775 / NCIMB 8073 / NRS 134) TaxID=446466 RepID=D5UH49_CELFN|nr:TlpA disulfide reductase family protein [Cellulomonas flavigena]ADG73252.1 alkyl hydroperoxide reductase/ Thiol specific antioxidant/ Mal allergen [Cellulomonas flavigena DSM 20109]